MKVTADTITDEQIHELRKSTKDTMLFQGWNIHGLCIAALKLYGPDHNGTRPLRRDLERAASASAVVKDGAFR